MTAVRVSEPVVWNELKEFYWSVRDDFCRTCCCSKKGPSRFSKISQESKLSRQTTHIMTKQKEFLNTFLASSLNVELVYTILKGVSASIKHEKE